MSTHKIIKIMGQSGELVVTPKSLARCRNRERKRGRILFPKTGAWLKVCWENGVSPGEALGMMDSEPAQINARQAIAKAEGEAEA